MSEIKQSVAIGFTLALITAIMWGIVPIAMKQILTDMRPNTLVWFRFVMSTIGLGMILAWRRQLPSLTLFRKRRWLIVLLIGAVGLGGNFLFFSSALQFLTPTASQVIAQLSPVGMMLASVLILKERMRPTQVIGAITLIFGLLLFFNTNLVEIFTQRTDFTKGIILGASAAGVWVSYGVAQKILLRRLGSQQILLLLYALCTLFIFPFASLNEVLNLNSWQLICLAFCGLNTVVAYGALAEAMARWQAAQVSAILTFTPLFTLLFSDLFSFLWPDLFVFQVLNTVGYIGALMVVSGAMCSAIGHRWWPKKKEKQLVVPLSS